MTTLLPRTAPSLADVQRWLRWLITEPRGVEAALGDRVGEPDPGCLDCIADGADMVAAERLDIYAEGYFVRMAGALIKDFPGLHRALGDLEFRRLAARYLHAHPSHCRNIDEVGGALATFLGDDPLTRERPYLPDLAAVEWAVLCAFWADDLPGLDPAFLATIPDEAWSEALLTFDPSVRLICSDWPIDDLWHGRMAPSLLSPVEPAQRNLVVHRSDLDITVERLDSVEFRALQLFAAGRTFGDVADRLVEWPDAATQLGKWFEGWIARGLIRAVSAG